MNIAILDDYQSIALEMVDWSALSDTAGPALEAGRLYEGQTEYCESSLVCTLCMT